MISAEALPPPYRWLIAEPGPKMLREALALYGTLEVPGEGDSPTILAWAAELGERAMGAPYRHDSTPWCGTFLAIVAKRAGKTLPAIPLRAMSWLAFGAPSSIPMLGDVLVFARSGGGHVALYVGEDDRAYHCLGGNQSDAVTIARIAKTRLHAARRPVYRVQPANVRRVVLSAAGALSRNEA